MDIDVSPLELAAIEGGPIVVREALSNRSAMSRSDGQTRRRDLRQRRHQLRRRRHDLPRLEVERDGYRLRRRPGLAACPDRAPSGRRSASSPSGSRGPSGSRTGRPAGPAAIDQPVFQHRAAHAHRLAARLRPPSPTCSRQGRSRWPMQSDTRPRNISGSIRPVRSQCSGCTTPRPITGALIASASAIRAVARGATRHVDAIAARSSAGGLSFSFSKPARVASDHGKGLPRVDVDMVDPGAIGRARLAGRMVDLLVEQDRALAHLQHARLHRERLAGMRLPDEADVLVARERVDRAPRAESVGQPGDDARTRPAPPSSWRRRSAHSCAPSRRIPRC